VQSIEIQELNSSMMTGCGPNVTNWQYLSRHSSQYSEVFPTRLLFRSPQFATIGHTPPNCEEELASSNRRLLVRASAAYIPQRHGELCNPPVAVFGSVDDLLRCGTPAEQHDAIKAQVGLSLPDFAVSAAAPARSKIRAAAASGWTCARVVLGWLFVRTENIDRWLEYGKQKHYRRVEVKQRPQPWQPLENSTVCYPSKRHK
jgi:hypothetical protein